MSKAKLKVPLPDKANAALRLIEDIDWELLRKQKLWLLQLDDIPTAIPEEAYGLIHLLDAIQDFAVDVMGVSEKEVFDFEEQKGGVSDAKWR